MDVDKEAPNTSEIIKMTVNNSKSTEIYEKIGSLTGLVTLSILNTKVPEIENKIKTWCL